MQIATVGHLLRKGRHDNEILLGKRAHTLFCDGIWNGPGGRFRDGESTLTCLRREVFEEIGVKIVRPSSVHVATVDLYHPLEADGHSLEWRVYFFTVREWYGEPKPTKKFDSVDWFPINHLPYGQMMTDQIAWLPLMFRESGKRLLIAEIYYGNKELTVIDKGSFRFEERVK